MIALSPRQREALCYFAGDARSNPFAGGTISSLRRAGLVAIVPETMPRCYRMTDKGRAAAVAAGDLSDFTLCPDCRSVAILWEELARFGTCAACATGAAT